MIADDVVRESVLLYSLNHENIIKVKDFYKVESGKFISIMEYQDCYNLQEIVTDPEIIIKKNKKFAD